MWVVHDRVMHQAGEHSWHHCTRAVHWLAAWGLSTPGSDIIRREARLT